MATGKAHIAMFVCAGQVKYRSPGVVAMRKGDLSGQANGKVVSGEDQDVRDIAKGR